MHWFFISWPEIVVLASAFATAYGWINVKALIKKKYSAITINGIGMIGGGILAFITSLLFEQWNPVPVYQWGPFLIGVLLLILIGNIITYNALAFLLNRFTPTFLTFMGFVTPLFAALYDWIFFGQMVSTGFFVTAFLVFVGLYIFYQEELREIHEPS